MMDAEERYSLVDSFGSVVLHNVLIAFSESLWVLCLWVLCIGIVQITCTAGHMHCTEFTI